MQWNPARLIIFDDFMRQTTLAQQHFRNPDTYLLWQEPEPTEIARLSLQGRVADQTLLENAGADRKSEEDAPTIPLAKATPVYERWAKYFQEVHKWDGESAKVDITVPIADLPPDLRALTGAAVRHQIYGGAYYRGEEAIDEFWDTARLTVAARNGQRINGAASTRGRAEEIPYLFLIAPVVPEIGLDGRPLPVTRVEGNLVGRLKEPAPFATTKITRVLSPSTAGAAITPPPLVTPDRFLERLFPAALTNDAALQVKVSMEAKRRPLKTVLSDLKQQSGVALAFAPGFPAATSLLTMRVSEFPLSQLMAAVSRIYGVTWSKEGATYTLRPAKLDPLEAKMLRVGSAYRSRFFFSDTNELKQKQRGAIAREVLRHVRRDQVESVEGAPWLEVPQELRDSIRKEIQEEGAAVLIERQGRLDFTPQEGWVLRFAPTLPGPQGWWGNSPYDSRGDAYLNVYAADGKLITPVFQRFRIHAPRTAPQTWTPLHPPMPEGWKPGDP